MLEDDGVQGTSRPLTSRSGVLRIVVAYAFIAAVYIAVSDTVVISISHGLSGDLASMQVVKGLLFVAVTSLVLLLLLWRHDKQQRIATQQIVEARESFESLFESTPVPLILYQLDSLAILAANRASCQQFGYSKAEILDAKLTGLYPPGELEKIIAHVAKIGARPMVGTFCHQCKDGTHFDASIVSHPLIFGGEHCRLIVVTDLTAQHELERKIMDAEMARREAERCKSALLSRTSHEMRTPLHGILGFLELLRDEKDPVVCSSHLATIEESANRLLILLEQVIRAAELSSGQVPLSLREAPLAGLLDMAISQVRESAIRKGIPLRAEILPGVPEILLGDHEKLNEVLVLLLGNAIKFSFDGEVVLCAEMLAGAGGEMLRFSVVDRGIGIPEAERQHIFEDFSQVDESHTRDFGGLGLGLGLVKHLCDLMKVSIQLDSAPGKGTRFCIDLPGRLVDQVLFEVGESSRTE